MSKIYVLSTYLDLQEHRAQLEKVICRMGHTDVAMEYYVAEARVPSRNVLPMLPRAMYMLASSRGGTVGYQRQTIPMAGRLRKWSIVVQRN